jgi:hypothetical protein
VDNHEVQAQGSIAGVQAQGSTSNLRVRTFVFEPSCLNLRV